MCESERIWSAVSLFYLLWSILTYDCTWLVESDHCPQSSGLETFLENAPMGFYVMPWSQHYKIQTNKKQLTISLSSGFGYYVLANQNDNLKKKVTNHKWNCLEGV